MFASAPPNEEGSISLSPPVRFAYYAELAGLYSVYSTVQYMYTQYTAINPVAVDLRICALF